MLPSLLFSVLLMGATSTATPAAVATSPAADAVLPTPQFRRYGTAEGLPNSDVYAVAQAPDGAMWFGTKSGLARYDGVRFKALHHVAGDAHSLFDNGIDAILFDKAGQLWATGLEAGLNRYDARTETFQHWGHVAGDASSLSSDKVWALAQTADGSLWVGSAGGLDRLRADGRGFDHVPVGDRDASAIGTVYALFVDAHDQLWLSTDAGVFRRDVQGHVHLIHADDPQVSLDAWRIEGDGDEVRVAASHALFVVGPDDVAHQLGKGDIPDTDVLASVRDRAGRLWIGTHLGLFLQQRSGEPVRSVTNQPVLYGNLPGTWVWAMHVDREGGLWIALFEGGVAYLAPGWNSVSRFTHIPDDDSSLRDLVAYSVGHGHDHTVWVGERAGKVDRLWPSTGKVEHVLSGLGGDVVGLTEDAQAHLWVIAHGALLRYRDNHLDKVQTRGRMSHPLEVEVGPGGRLYARTFGEGLFRIDQDSMAVTPVPAQPADEKVRWGSQMTLHDGVFWYACDAGLWRLDHDGDHFEPVPGVSRDISVYAYDFIADGLWLARPDGLEHYHRAGDGLVLDRKVDAARGWPSLNVVDLAVDSRGRVWIFTHDGLWRYDPADGHFHTLGLQDGLSNGEFVTAFSRGDDGTLYAPTLGGVMAFNPDHIEPHPQPPPVAISRISVIRHGQQVDLPVPATNELQLGWRDRGLAIEARAVSYVNPEANRYRFFLHGLDTGWVDVGNHGSRDFTGLGAGSYVLDVMAAGTGDPWGHLPHALDIHVQSPPWARWWAYGIYVLLAALATWWFMQAWRRRLAGRHQIQLAEQRHQLAEKASAAKTQFLATLSHEIRTPMTGVLGMAELLLSTPLSHVQRNYAQAMQRSGGILLKLLNDALDLARIESGKFELDSAPFDLPAMVGDVVHFGNAQASAKGLHFAVETPAGLPHRVVGDVVRIKQVLFNLINNAVKFTERGSVTLRVRHGDDGLHASVIDTGPGISEAEQLRLFQRFEQVAGPQRHSGTGLGLAICRELVALMGGSIHLESKLAHGSTFHVLLPLPLADEEPVTTPAPHVDEPSPHALRVLLVEDDDIVAAVITGLLQRDHHQVRCVGHGLAAMAELAEDGCDVILLDLDLPGLDGFQLARLIRQREEPGRRTPIIAITARTGGDEEAMSKAAGMDGFLRKPLTGEQLAAAIREQVVPGETAGV